MTLIKGIGVVLGVIIALNTVAGLAIDDTTPLGMLWAFIFGPGPDPFDPVVIVEMVMMNKSGSTEPVVATGLSPYKGE